MEADRIRGVAPGITVHPLEEVGIDELYRQGLGALELRSSGRRARARTPGSRTPSCRRRSRSAYLDRIRRDGVELTVDQEVFDDGAGSRPARSSPASGARREPPRPRW